MLSTLSEFENPAPVFNLQTGWIDMDRTVNISARKKNVSAIPGGVVVYAMPANMARSTVQTARDIFLEVVGEYTRGVRHTPALEEALRCINQAWPKTLAPKSLNVPWLNVVNNRNAETTVPALYKTISTVLKLMEDKDGAINVDEALRRIEVRTASLQHTIAVLRALSSHKNTLENWKPLRERLKEAVEARRGELKVEPTVFTRGLWQDE